MQVKERHYEKVEEDFEQVHESYRKFHPAFVGEWVSLLREVYNLKYRIWHWINRSSE
jgi:hypothetical protein